MTIVDPANGIKAIQTRYAGCHFRSRLEARWAVFFDTLGIRWEYEPEGFAISTQDEEPEEFYYLPDFRLPDLNVWVEVKGRLSGIELRRLCEAVCPHGLSIGGRLMLLGAIPEPHPDESVAPHHALLEFHKGDIFVGRRSFNMGWSSNSPGPHGVPSLLDSPDGVSHSVWCDSGQLYEMDPNRLLVADQLRVTWISCARDIAAVRAAYTAARSARFEHGQSGAA